RQALLLTAAGEGVLLGLLLQRVAQAGVDVLAVVLVGLVGAGLVGLAAGEEGEQAEGGAGDVVAGAAAGLAAAVAQLAAGRPRLVAAVQVELVHRPAAVGRLVLGEPLQAAGHRRLGLLVAAALLAHPAPPRPAAA